MPPVGMFEQVIAVLRRSTPLDIDLVAIEIHHTDDRFRVDLVTPEAGRLIGRRGATADEVRLAIAQAIGLPAAEVQLNISEPQGPPPPRWPPFDPGDDPPAEPPSGVREPRRPPPGGLPPSSLPERPDAPG